MNDFIEKKNSGWQSLIILLLLTFACSLGIQFIVMLLGFFTGGVDISGNQDSVRSMLDSRFFTSALLAASSFGTFYLPAVFLQKRESYYEYFPTYHLDKYLFYVLAVVLLVVFAPLMEVIGDWNASMKLPSYLKGIEQWMREQEDTMAVLTKKMVMVDNVWFLLLNIVVMAVLPAIAEEYYFRGSLMHIIGRLVKNHHLAIWITAFIFSAIHVQFFGFFLRLILGAFFGYMLVWTKNVWVPILAHFVNNALVTILAYYYTKQGKSFEDLQVMSDYPIFVYIGSLLLTIGVIVLFVKNSKEEKYSNGERLG